MKVLFTILTAIFLCSMAINACRKSDMRRYPLPPVIKISLPEGFPEPVLDFFHFPLTQEGIELGRHLFYESQLSAYNDVSCGNCHQQHAAFTQFDHDLGHGTNFQHTTRNNPGIFNMIWHPSMQWDGGVALLEQQVIACMTASEKMGETAGAVIEKLKEQSGYREMFGKAFGDENMTEARIANALTQFVATIISADSKYDRVKRGEAQFNASEQAGYELFQSRCASCHAEPLFTDFVFRNIGLPVNEFHPDYGRLHVTGNPSDSLKFKTPSLRNVALTGYYTHDGRFPEFTQVLDHYSGSGMIPMTNLEKFYLQEFLFTLTDSSLINDQRFAAP